MDKVRMCLLDETKVCDDCGECDRCDLDPNKICDNCCRCLALEDESEFRTVTVDGTASDYHASSSFGADIKTALDRAAGSDKKLHSHKPKVISLEREDEPTELTPQLVAYWEQKLREYGEAPADDGLGEIRVSTRVPVSGVRQKRTHKNNRHEEH